MKEQQQLEIIKELFTFAQAEGMLLFLKGGWNIDLQLKLTSRPHSDVDFHFNFADSEKWIGYFRDKGYNVTLVDQWYFIAKEGKTIILDFEAVQLSGKSILWKHGGKSFQKDVFEDFTYDGQTFLGMKLSVEKYLKEKQPLRDKDKIDLKLLAEHVK